MPILAYVENLADIHNPAETDPPSRYHRGRLFPFQERVVAHLANQPSALLSATSALGTVETTVAAAQTHLASGDVERVVILTQSPLAYLWVRELEKTYRASDVLLINDSPGARWRTYATTPAKWIIVCYSFLDHDVAALTPLMASSLLVIDSGTQVKNPIAARTIAAKALSDVAARRLSVVSACNRYRLYQWTHLFKLALDPLGTDPGETETASAQTWRNRPEYSILAVTKND